MNINTYKPKEVLSLYGRRNQAHHLQRLQTRQSRGEQLDSTLGNKQKMLLI